MADGRKKPFWHKKRRSGGDGSAADDEGIELEDLRTAQWANSEERSALFRSFDASDTYDMMKPGEKERLARDLWTCNFSSSATALRSANAALVDVLRAQLVNTSPATESSISATERHIDGVLLDLCRAQNMHKIPLITAASALLCEVNGVAREFHDVVSAFHRGFALSEKWVHDFLKIVNACRPAPSHAVIAGLRAVCFDNLSVKVDYKSYSSGGETGHRKDMTNWFSTPLPAFLVPPSFDAGAIFLKGPFRTDLSLYAFGQLFYADNAEIAANKRSRWVRFLRAADNGQLLARPATRPLWQPFKTYHEPIPDALQSSYADVEKELRVMCQSFPSETFIFVAGDGLALMRLNHLLANKADVYIHQTPMVIPIQGEHPHGLFHAMHCQWRLHRQFLLWCAKQVDNDQVIEDPNVSVFNAHRFFFLNVVTRACAEYISLISKTPGSETLDEPEAFVRKAEANIDFAWVCHFEYDAGFFILDFLQSVRGNASHTLDLLWREFFASAHSGTAHKTQYVPMAIMRVFWGMALVPELSDLYHKIRTIPSGTHDGSGVGWDMAIEMLNAAIKAHVCHRISDVQIQHFIQSWALLESVQRRMRDYIYPGRTANAHGHHSVNATPDVDRLVERFKEVIGKNWQAATAPNKVSHVTVGAARTKKPWTEVEEVMARTGADAPAAYIRSHVLELTKPFFGWNT